MNIKREHVLSITEIAAGFLLATVASKIGPKAVRALLKSHASTPGVNKGQLYESPPESPERFRVQVSGEQVVVQVDDLGPYGLRPDQAREILDHIEKECGQ